MRHLKYDLFPEAYGSNGMFMSKEGTLAYLVTDTGMLLNSDFDKVIPELDYKRCYPGGVYLKKLFVAIRQGDIDLVKELLKKKPELISCTAKQPPKKDDGQSPLQITIKSGNFDIAEFLLDCGADVNFIEVKSRNEWKMPVIQDAIMAVVRNTRFLTFTYKNGNKVWEICRTKDQFDKALNCCKRCLI